MAVAKKVAVEKRLSLVEVHHSKYEKQFLYALQTYSGPSWEQYRNAKVSSRYPLTGQVRPSWMCLKTWEPKSTPCFVNWVGNSLIKNVIYYHYSKRQHLWTRNQFEITEKSRRPSILDPCVQPQLWTFETRIYFSNLLELLYLTFSFLFFFSGFNAIPGLSTVDYVTVAVIEKYLDFKVKIELLNWVP